MGGQQPFLYERAEKASWEPKPKKPKQNGPLLSFNRHPDLQQPINYRSSNYSPMSRRTKQWIVWMRRVQLCLRVLELMGAIGALTLMILITNVEATAAWILRITAGVAMVHCAYGIFHLSRPAGGRTPTSSAAYQLFAGLSDICVMPLYAFGAVATQKNSQEWSTRLENKDLVSYLVRAFYYLVIGAGGLHFVSLCISLWLGFMFRKITMMPPDMNPLEDHLTARKRHKKSKSSVSTVYTNASSEKRLSTPLEERRRSGVPYEDVARPPTIPFMHTRSGSVESTSSNHRDSRLNLPSRHYQIPPGNSPRNSGTSADFMPMAMPASASQVRSANRGSYTEVPLQDNGSSIWRPSSGGAAAQPGGAGATTRTSQSPRVGKFTETWSATDSLIARTQERNRAINAAAMEAERKRTSKSYEALGQRYSYPDSGSESDGDENNLAGSDFEDDVDMGSRVHPNPLRSNPPTPKGTPPRATPPRPKTPYSPFRASALSDVDLNDRRVSGTNDIADEKPRSQAQGGGVRPSRYRNSSIQPETDFYSKPYGTLKPATPPIMVGSNRQVSSGNDYDMGNGCTVSTYGRRNVSGKTAEEGRAGQHYSRFSRLDE